jgi:hypothetical protein
LKTEGIDLSIIIVSYNTADLIGVCISSIESVDGHRKEIFVVDNASTDGTVESVRRDFPSINVIANRTNLGFAAANNHALPLCRGKYILLLNPDMEFLPSTFRFITSYMEANPRVGLAGVKLINPDGSPQESFSREYPGQKHTASELKNLQGSIAWVLGAGMVIRAALIKKLGGFDEDFFVYGEDQDLCLRIRKAGYEIGYIDTALMVHLGGQSERRTPSEDLWRKKILAEFIFYRKHYLPRTIRRITRSNLMKAIWRIATLKLLLPFCRSRMEAEEKLAKYRAIVSFIRSEIMEQKGTVSDEL